MSNMIHTILFNNPLQFEDQTGVYCYNVTTRTKALSISSETELPAKMITYHVRWVVDPLAGDRVEWRYDGKGSYRDTSHIAMGAKDLRLINCADLID